MATTLLDASGRSVFHSPAAPSSSQAAAEDGAEKKRIIRALCQPFPVEYIRWVATRRSIVNGAEKGLCYPLVAVDHYMDRLDAVLGEGMWSRSFSLNTIDNITVRDSTGHGTLKGKLTLICTLEIPGIGRNAGTGEAWTDNPHAITSADAQAFRRAAECFGMGRYLRRISLQWLEINSEGTVLKPPMLPDFAIPPFSSGPPAALSHDRANQQASNLLEFRKTTTGSDASRNRMLDKKAQCIRILGDALYADVVDLARKSMPAQVSNTELRQHIEKELDSACAMLAGARHLGAEIGVEYLHRVLDAYQVQNFDSVPSLKALKNISLALETVHDVQS